MTAKYSTRGIPIVALPIKLKYLESCLEDGSNEDAAGHLCDLLEMVRNKLLVDHRDRFRDLQHMVSYYGRDPTPIEPDSFHAYYLGIETLDTPK